MAAQKILIMGESGTGKTTSIRNCDPTVTAIVNPVGKALPFRGKFDTLNDIVKESQIIPWVKQEVNAGKRMIVIDDFQYILSVPYMNRINEPGWDKWNDFGANYFALIEMCKDLPEDVTVYYLTHCETLDNGITTVKLIGKMLREKITIEGLFTTVLKTGVAEGRYFFYTHNSGKDTVKSPIGMFDSDTIDNDLKYVDDKVRNYYGLTGAKTDEEIKQDDAAAAVEVPQKTGHRRSRSKAAQDAPEAPNKAVLDRDAYFFIEAENNAVARHAGDEIPAGAVEISKSQYGAAIKEFSTKGKDADLKAVIDLMAKNEVPFDELEKHPAIEEQMMEDTGMNPPEAPAPKHRHRRTRKEN